MAQHDYTIANQTFPNTRTDLNNVFAAIVSQNSGATAPSTTYAYMLWYDTTTDILKMRNANDDAWIDLFTISQTADTATASGSQGRNLIINGAMQVWQRTTSVTTSSSGTFSADRWASNAGASTVFSRSTDVPTGFQYSLSVAGATFTGIRTRIEAADCKRIAGQEVTFSWYAKRTAGTGDMRTYLGYASAEDNFGTVTLIEDVVNTASASVSSDWARYTYTITLPANAANGLHFIVYNGSASGAVTTLYTGVQLEVGSATPFEHRSYADELARCQRYLRLGGAGVYGIYNSAANIEISIPFSPDMRAAPTLSMAKTTVTISNKTNSVTGTATSVSATNISASPSGAFFAQIGNCNVTSASAGHIAQFRTDEFLQLDAEL